MWVPPPMNRSASGASLSLTNKLGREAKPRMSPLAMPSFHQADFLNNINRLQERSPKRGSVLEVRNADGAKQNLKTASIEKELVRRTSSMSKTIGEDRSVGQSKSSNNPLTFEVPYVKKLEDGKVKYLPSTPNSIYVSGRNLVEPSGRMNTSPNLTSGSNRAIVPPMPNQSLRSNRHPGQEMSSTLGRNFDPVQSSHPRPPLSLISRTTPVATPQVYFNPSRPSLNLETTPSCMYSSKSRTQSISDKVAPLVIGVDATKEAKTQLLRAKSIELTTKQASPEPSFVDVPLDTLKGRSGSQGLKGFLRGQWNTLSTKFFEGGALTCACDMIRSNPRRKIIRLFEAY